MRVCFFVFEGVFFFFFWGGGSRPGSSFDIFSLGVLLLKILRGRSWTQELRCFRSMQLGRG